jgi:hypothetical protein
LRFEVFTVRKVQMLILWVYTPCSIFRIEVSRPVNRKLQGKSGVICPGNKNIDQSESMDGDSSKRFNKSQRTGMALTSEYQLEEKKSC